MNALKRSNILLWILPWACLFWVPLASVIIVLMLINNYTLPGAFKSFRYLKKWPVAIALIALFLYTLASGLWSDDLHEWWVKVQIKLTFIALPIAFLPVIKFWKRRSANQFMASFHSSVVAVMMFCYLEEFWMAWKTGKFSFGFTQNMDLFYSGLSEPFGHPAFLSMYVGIAIFVAFFFARTEPNRRRFWSFWVLFDALFLFLLMEKMNLIAFGVVSAIALISIGIRYKAWWRVSFLMLLPVVVFVLLLVYKPFKIVNSRFRNAFTFSYDITSDKDADFSSLTIRLPIWASANDVISENPLVGVGAGDAREALIQKFEENNFTLGIKNEFNCHNQYLESMLAGGLVGLIILLIPFVTAFSSGLRRKRGVLMATTGFFMLSMLTESMFERFQGVALFTLILVVLSAPVFKAKTQ